jgi:RimJ/RimL family protein N-acetyltransferase
VAGLIAADGDVVIRRMRDEDAEYDRMAGWLNTPHVREWWDPDDPPATRASVRAHHGPRVAGSDATTACVIEVDGRPAGHVQFYPWAAYQQELAAIGVELEPGAYGLDILIGDPALVGVGVGTRVVDLLSRHLAEACGATAVALTTAVDNARAIRAYEKAGFARVQRVLDTDTRGGERIESHLMVRRFGGADA